MKKIKITKRSMLYEFGDYVPWTDEYDYELKQVCEMQKTIEKSNRKWYCLNCNQHLDKIYAYIILKLEEAGLLDPDYAPICCFCLVFDLGY